MQGKNVVALLCTAAYLFFILNLPPLTSIELEPQNYGGGDDDEVVSGTGSSYPIQLSLQ